MSEFSDDQLDEILKMAQIQKDSAESVWTQEKIFALLDQTIIGNLNYKQKLSMVLAAYLSPEAQRTHSLVIGPSGTGKTYMLEKALPLFKVPYRVIAAGGLVAAGFSGMNLKDNIRDFYKGNPDARKKSIIVIDEFDKISTHAGKSDQFSNDLQSELLTLVQGEQDMEIDTRNSIWIFLGAFSYAKEMKAKEPKMGKSELTQYGFKPELLGRISMTVMTDIPTLKDMLSRLNNDEKIAAFKSDMKRSGYEISWEPTAFLELSNAVQESPFGMRLVGDVTGELRSVVGFGGFEKGAVHISTEMVKKAIAAV